MIEACVNSVHPYGTDTSYSPGALPTDSLAAPDLISDIVGWLAGDGSSLVTADRISADKGYLKI